MVKITSYKQFNTCIMEFKVLNKTRQSVIIKTDLGNRHMNWDQFNDLMVINKDNPKVAEIQQEAALSYFEAEIYIARLLHLFAKGIDGLDDNVAARAFSKEVCELLGIDQKELQVILDKRFAEIQNRIVNTNSVQQIKMKPKEVKTLNKVSEVPFEKPKEESCHLDAPLSVDASEAVEANKE